MLDRLEGFDDYAARVLAEWNCPGLAVGVVAGEELVFARGYGYRDVEAKLPFTPATLWPIASNTKLFTAVAAGLLVEDGKLTWDEPIHEAVSTIRFSTEALTNSVTLRDMLSHRTGITRHDAVWYGSGFTRAELFARLRYLRPREPLRAAYLYNNLMYAAVGQIMELVSGQTWEEVVRSRLLDPLAMPHSVFTIADMLAHSDHAVAYAEQRDGTALRRLPYYKDMAGLAPAGGLISSVEELGHWLAALINDGVYGGKQIVPRTVLEATLAPASPMPNILLETRGFGELLNSAYGMGRSVAVYRGHLLAGHTGSIDGFHSRVAFLPQARLGVIVAVNGDHGVTLRDSISYHLFERLLGLDFTPWSERWLAVRAKEKQAGAEARAKAGAQRVPDTRPAHPAADYAGVYEHPAYGALTIAEEGGELTFAFHGRRLPLAHFHFERFDTPDDERLGKWSVNFVTNPLGDVDRAEMSLDEAEAIFVRRPERLADEDLAALAGTYETASGLRFAVAVKGDGALWVVVPGEPRTELAPYHGRTFRHARFGDQTVEFVVADGAVTLLRQRGPTGENECRRVAGAR
jgi:CubicO group peptidase (beta-lactamase class C family)